MPFLADMQLVLELLTSLLLVLMGIFLIGIAKRDRRFKSLKMIPIKKENKKARTIVLLVILASLILGIGMLVNNGTVVLKW